MRVMVESGSYADAADECRTANQIAALLTESLAGKLGGFGGMAGDDATSAEFAATYDEGARAALDTLTDLTHGFIGLGRLLAASGANHRDAEAASAAVSMYTGGSLHDDDFVRVRPNTPPSSLGASSPSLGTIDAFILDQIEGFVWPGADVDLLLEAGTAWRRTADAVLDLQAHCSITAGLLEHQVSPEVPLALDALAEMRELVGDTAGGLLQMAAACEDYAAAVRATHDRTLALLKEIGQMVVEGAAISLILGGLTGGLGAGAAGAAALARIAAQAPRFHALLTTLRVVVTASATRVRAARESLVVVRTRLDKFARISRSERGAVRLPGGPHHRPPLPPARPTPQVESAKLNNYVTHLFKGTTNPKRVGDGTTMDAIRHELLTGEKVHDSSHLLKGPQIVRGLKVWLRKNPGASPSDRDVAQSLLDELKEVLGQ